MTTERDHLRDNDRLSALARAHSGTGVIRLEDDEQTFLAEVYAFGLRARDQLAATRGSARVQRQLRGYARASETASELLIRSLRGLVLAMCTDFAKKRLGRRWAAQELDDLVGDGILITLDSCAQYDASRGTTVAQWVAKQLRQHLQSLDFHAGGGVVPREWRRVAAAMNAVEQSRAARGALSGAYSTDDVMAVLVENEEKRQMTKGLDRETAALKARDSLSRQSVLRAMREVGDIAALNQGVMSIAKPLDDTGHTFEDVLSHEDVLVAETRVATDTDAFIALMGVLPANQVSDATTRHGSAGDDVSYRAIADERGGDWLEIRQGVERVKAAPGAPHAQFCAFYPHLESLIEYVSEKETPAAVGFSTAGVRELLAARR